MITYYQALRFTNAALGLLHVAASEPIPVSNTFDDDTRDALHKIIQYGFIVEKVCNIKRMEIYANMSADAPNNIITDTDVIANITDDYKAWLQSPCVIDNHELPRLDYDKLIANNNVIDVGCLHTLSPIIDNLP